MTPAPDAGTPAAVLAPTPPMGWNDWGHYQCEVDEQIVMDNARALVQSGLAGKGYDIVTVDDCWMAGSRDANGDLVADPGKFPHGMAWLGASLHALGLRFGIYQDAGAKTCEGRPGSGQPEGGGGDHFAQDARLFASWGVDYLKLDGCNLWVPPGKSKEEAFRAAYEAQAAAIAASGRKIVFSESAPAYFSAGLAAPSFDQGQWYSVIGWSARYGQLWRLGSDIQIFDAWQPDASRWESVMTNYRYTRDVPQFTRPGSWNDPDFIIAGDPGLTADESRSQLALWAMMSAPLILSSDVPRLAQSPSTLALLGNEEVIAVDQDPLGEAAALVGTDATFDVLVKRLANGDRAIAILNHGPAAASYGTTPETLGFGSCATCTYRIRNLWDRSSPEQISVTLPSHATALFRVAQVR